jgi:hypothetical protein
VIWLIVYIVGLPVQILTVQSFDFGSQTLNIAYMLDYISSYTSSIVAVVWVSVIKRKMFIKVIEYITQVDNKLRYTQDEETHMNRKVMFNIISEIILLSLIQCTLITYNIYQIASEPFYYIVKATINYVPVVCNALMLFQFVNLVFVMKQRYSHLNKRLTNWVNRKDSKAICLNKQNERRSLSNRAVGNAIVTSLCVSSIEDIEGTSRQTDIHLLRQIYSELYDITCLLNDTYGVPILVTVCWMLIGFVLSLYEALFHFNEWGVQGLTYGISLMVLFFKVMFFCHTATNEARASRILVEKLLLKGNCRNECVEELRMFSLQLQAMEKEYTAGGFFSLNLRLFTSVVSVIATYIVILVQTK